MQSSKIIATCLLLTITIFTAQSQDGDDLALLFRAGALDANTYLQKYTETAGLSFNSGLGSGWYNTAKPHKTLGFDITASVSLASIPSSDILFNFNDSDYENLRFLSGDRQVPTLFGGSRNRARLQIPAGTTITDPVTGESITYQNDINVNSPEGLVDANDFPIVGAPVPALQLGIGIFKNTELKVRYASDFNVDENLSARLFGIGVMHDIKQWIPGLKQLPLDISGFFGYTSLKINYTFDFSEPGFAFQNGNAELKASATTIQVVASKEISVITPYVGVGYSIASSSMKVQGQVTYQDGSQEVNIQDPVNLEFNGGSTARLNAGLRLKLAVITIHGEYALQKYNTFTAGIGISVR